MLSGRGSKALLPLGLQIVYVKGWKQAGEEEAENKDMGTAFLDLTTRVLSLIQVSGNRSLGKKGRKQDKQGGFLSSPCCPSCSLPTLSARATKHVEGQH